MILFLRGFPEDRHASTMGHGAWFSGATFFKVQGMLAPEGPPTGQSSKRAPFAANLLRPRRADTRRPTPHARYAESESRHSSRDGDGRCPTAAD